jgi:hypothetical protein
MIHQVQEVGQFLDLLRDYQLLKEDYTSWNLFITNEEGNELK